MTTRVLYVPANRELDLSRLSESDYQTIASLRGKIGRGDRVLLCLEPAVAGHDEMFVRRRDGKYYASHFAGGGHGTHEIARESDEHKRQKEYWHRAGDDAGFPSTTEFTTSTGSVLDVAIHGPTRTGVEVQLSRINVSTAGKRTARSHRAGWLSLWFTAAERPPKWFHRVPSVGCNHIPWDDLPPRGSAVATGLRRVHPAKCTAQNFDSCPKNNHRHCGGDHPKLRPWAGLTLDHVAGLVPAGQAVPLMTTGRTVYLVPPNDLRLYEGLTGGPARYNPELPPDADRASAKPTHSASHLADSGVECERCGQRLLWKRPGRVLCERCDPIMRLPISPYPL
ncbi:hypothetical protein [Saccharothrix obliqua]|uniref:hypothetical protein n=1 Tax=Saccharothrix obliqua TaxID=2861747 RepID=UPI001C5DFFA5|nr:hypothetical protein [Saccharothrix obliqua]MBW4721569.1 hypothetical protein [Saccharothrix obliqua]